MSRKQATYPAARIIPGYRIPLSAAGAVPQAGLYSYLNNLSKMLSLRSSTQSQRCDRLLELNFGVHFIMIYYIMMYFPFSVVGFFRFVYKFSIQVPPGYLVLVFDQVLRIRAKKRCPHYCQRKVHEHSTGF